MSRDTEDPRPPRKPKPPQSAKQPAPEYDVSDPTSTWRPNPAPSPSPKKTKAPDPTLSETPPTTTRSLGKVKIETIRAGDGPTWWERIFFGRVSSGLLAQFCRQFAAYLDAGVDIVKALSGLEKQFQATPLGPVIGRMALGIRKGDNLSDVVARESGAFDALFLSLIRVAEARGGVPETLRRMGRHYEARQSLIRQAKSAMIYPIAVLLIASIVIAILTIFVLPIFAKMLKEMAPRESLPLPSQVLMVLSDFMAKVGWLLVPAVMIATPILAFRAYKSAAGKRFIDQAALYVPVLGQLLRKIDTARFAQTLSTLQESGIDMGTSLDLTADVMRLDPFRRAVKGAKRTVLDGAELSTALLNSRCFAHDVIAIIGSGEETGKLPESLDRLAKDYEEQVAYMVRNMGQLVQPILMIFMGLVVLFIILAVMLPYISMLTSLTR